MIWILSYVKKLKNNFEKVFFKLMNKAIFGKSMENVRRHTKIKLVATESRRNCLVSEPNYHTTRFFRDNSLAMEIRKPQILMNKHAYLGLSLNKVNLSKTI